MKSRVKKLMSDSTDSFV